MSIAQKTNQRKTLGIAFGSGGIRGLAHVGVLQALIRNGITVDYIAGTSIGAWVGGMYALTQDIFLLEDATVGYQKDKLGAMREFTTKGGLIRGRKIRYFLDQWFEDKTFADCAIPFTAVTADLLSGDEHDITEGLLSPAVQASMAIPVLFKPIEHQDRVLVDGGIINPVPDNIVREMGADVVISVNIDHYKEVATFSPESMTLRNTAGRSFFLFRHYMAMHSTTSADIALEPHIELHGVQVWRDYFTSEKLREITEAGETAMEKEIPRLKELLDIA